jgi:hypothetical protein
MCSPHGRSLNVNTEDRNGGPEMGRPAEQCLGATMESKVTHRLVFAYLPRVLRASVSCADDMLRLHAMHRTINERSAFSMSGTHGPCHLWQRNKEARSKHNSTRGPGERLTRTTDGGREKDARHRLIHQEHMGVHANAPHHHQLERKGGGGMCPRSNLRGQKTTRFVPLLDQGPLTDRPLTCGNRTRQR